MNLYFIDFEKAHLEGDIVVFWSYKLKSEDKMPVDFERVGGWLVIPQGKN
jgi:hypothetical protein